MKDNFQILDDTRHMLQWLADEPYTEIRNNVESILREQVADSHLLDFAVTFPARLAHRRHPLRKQSRSRNHKPYRRGL